MENLHIQLGYCNFQHANLMSLCKERWKNCIEGVYERMCEYLRKSKNHQDVEKHFK